MFGLFKNKSSNGKENPAPQMKDIEGNELAVGDMVESLRYDLGKCRIVASEQGFDYESIDTGERVSYARMIDAATTFQKVKKI